MPTANRSARTETLAIEAAGVSVDLAAPNLARHLAISEAAAKALLRKGELRLGPNADALVSLLKSLGVTVRAASGRAASGRGLTVSLYTAAPDPQILAALSGLGLQADAASHAGGIVLTGQTQAQVEALRRDLRWAKQLELTVSDPVQARFDLFAPKPLPPHPRAALSAYLAQVGLPACVCSSALAVGLRDVHVRQVLARFADCGLLALDQAFQRFDLYLTGVGIPLREAADFLATRVDLTGVRLESVTPLAPLRLESGLNRSAARAFCADYASIGLHSAARLCGLK